MTLRMEVNGFLTRELYLYRSVRLQSHKHCNMLYGNIFLTAESAADQLVLDYNTGRIPAHHNGNFFSCVVCPLVGGIDLYTVLIREGNSTLRLHKGMLCKRCGEAVCHNILCVRNSCLRISATYMSLLAEISVLMNLRGIFRLGFRYTSHRLQDLILNLHKLFSRFQNRRSLCTDQTKRISDTAGNVPLFNHDIPVLLDMPDLIVRNVLRL